MTFSLANTDPSAVDDTETTEEDTPVEVSWLPNDSDPENDTLTVTSTTDPPHGSVTISSDGKTMTYTPDAGYVGEDTFNYTISDGHGGTDTATVTVTVERGINSKFTFI